MKLVVDTNVLMSYFFTHSTERMLLESSPFELISPSFALTELKKHKQAILKKCGSFDLKGLSFISFLDLSVYSNKLKQAASLTPDDIDFVALALHFACPIWTNEHFQEQQTVPLITTERMVRLLSKVI